MGTKLVIVLYISFLFYFNFISVIHAQEQNTQMNDSIQEKFVRVEIKSKIDNHMQPAIFYNSGSKTKKPLIIYLHSWSGNFLQGRSLAQKVIKLDWNYISPDFRGPNNNPEACGSPLVVSDIEDAIDYAVKNGNVNEKQIHIVGGSGGAHAALLSYMKVRRRVNSFSAWN